jgi:hypothetical protein
MRNIRWVSPLIEQTHQGQLAPKTVGPESKLSNASLIGKPQPDATVEEKGGAENALSKDDFPKGDLLPARNECIAKFFGGLLEDTFLEY